MTPKILNSVRLLLVLVSSSFGVLSAQWHSQVQIQVTDALGDPVPAHSITVSGPGSTIQVVQDKTIRLAYGQYTVNISAGGFEPATMSVVVDQPAQIITVGVKLGRMEDVTPPPCSIFGSVPPEVKAVKIRVVQLFGSYMTDVPVNANREFEVRDLDCGYYLLIAMEPSKFLGTMVARASTLPPRLKLNLTQSYEHPSVRLLFALANPQPNSRTPIA